MPVAFTTIVPVGKAQVGCVTAGAFTVGGTGIALMVTGFPAYGVEQAGALCNRTVIL